MLSLGAAHHLARNPPILTKVTESRAPGVVPRQGWVFLTRFIHPFDGSNTTLMM